jgi:hypothetical protein
MEGVKEATLDFGGSPLTVAVAHGLGNARKILDGMGRGGFAVCVHRDHELPGGCVGGGGQPILTEWEQTQGPPSLGLRRGSEAPAGSPTRTPPCSSCMGNSSETARTPLSHALAHDVPAEGSVTGPVESVSGPGSPRDPGPFCLRAFFARLGLQLRFFRRILRFSFI